MFISFIVPTWNVNKYLDDFFMSFSGIDRDIFELIVINDNGKENPKEIIDKYKADLNIKFIDLDENIGVDFVRQFGLKHISKKSTHFSFIDPDDVIDNKGFYLDVFTDKITVFDRSSFNLISKKMQKKGDIFSHAFWGSIWGIVFPIKIVSSVKFYYKANSDVLTQRELLKKYSNIIFLSNKSMVSRRYRKSSLTNASVSVEKMIRQIDIASDLIEKNLKSKFVLNQLTYWSFYLSSNNWNKTERIVVKKHLFEKMRISFIERFFFFSVARMMRLFRIDKKQFNTKQKNAFE